MLAKKIIIYETYTKLAYFKRNGKRKSKTKIIVDCKNCKSRSLCDANCMSTICMLAIQMKYYNTYFLCYIREKE